MRHSFALGVMESTLPTLFKQVGFKSAFCSIVVRVPFTPACDNNQRPQTQFEKMTDDFFHDPTNCRFDILHVVTRIRHVFVCYYVNPMILKILSLSSSRVFCVSLKELVPTFGPLYTRLPLVAAFNHYNNKYRSPSHAVMLACIYGECATVRIPLTIRSFTSDICGPFLQRNQARMPYLRYI